MIDCGGFTSARVTIEYGVKISWLDVIHCGNGPFCFRKKIGNSGKQSWPEIANATVDTGGFVLNQTNNIFWHNFSVIEKII